MTVSAPGEPTAAPSPATPGAGVPAPPAGPGAVPPFPAPPVEGRNFRLWLNLGVAALAVLLCCGGGAFAVAGLVITSTQALNEQARTVVEDYLEAVRDRRYDRAYQLLCADAQRRETPAAFRKRVAAEPDITAYRVGDVALTDEITVSVEVTYAGGRQDDLEATLVQDPDTAELKICGLD